MKDVTNLNDNKMLYITSNEIKEKFKQKKIFVFGTGLDTVSLLDDLKNEVNICAFVDNRRNGVTFYNRDVISKDVLEERYDSDSVVIIATYRFAHEILEGLNHKKWQRGKNCFIWDEECIFHMDNNTERFISFNRQIWGEHKRTGSQNLVLVPYDNLHSSSPIIYAYFANKMAEKYNAEIWGISSRGGDVKNESEVIKEVFRSFNVAEFISPQIENEKQRQLVETILEEVWQNVFTWEDWKNIHILDMQIGTSIVRYINRFYVFDFEPRTEHNKKLLKECIEIIVAIEDFFNVHHVSALILRDAVCWENFLRETAVKRGVPSYVLQQEGYYRRVGHDFCVEPHVVYYREFWNRLSEEEKKYGLQFAEKHLMERLGGSTEDIPYMEGHTVFLYSEKKRQFRKSDKIKILICPHLFEEDLYVCGEQIFDNNYISWLDHLGQLSTETSKYDWYIKMHPSSEYRDKIIIEKFLKRYPNITLIETETSPIQMKKEGLDVALTVYGTIAHEYAMLGITVINAGVNPHCAFDFSITPNTKEEYDYIIENLAVLDHIIKKEEIYKFYAIHYLYYVNNDRSISDRILNNPLLYVYLEELKARGLRRGTWMYILYMESFNKERHEKVYAGIDKIIDNMDLYRDNIFYKKDIKA